MSSSLAVSSGSDNYGSSGSSKKNSRGYDYSKSGGVTRIDIETIRLHLSSLVARLSSRISLDTLRPLPMFLGITPTGVGRNGGGGGSGLAICLGAGAFTPPIRKFDKSSLEKVKSRVSLNFQFFLTNYALLAGMVGTVVALMHPGMILLLGVVYALWSFHSYLIRNELDLFGLRVHAILSIQQRWYILFVITAIVVGTKCLMPTIIFFILSTLLVCIHALFRDPKHIETMDLLSDGGRDAGSDDEEGHNSGGSSGSENMVLVENPISPSGASTSGVRRHGGGRPGDVI